MKRLLLLPLVFLAFTLLVNAQNKKEKDQNAIKSMCGCYEVSFNFAETFTYSNDTSYVPSKVKHDKALEWIELVEDTDDRIVMQHLLIVGKQDKPAVIKHWRQDWLYENTELYTYYVDNKWNYNQLSAEDVKGQWTQKVFQVDDSPRYEGSATWVHVDGKSFWENTTDAPLPRREYTKRSDYNVTVRTNKHAITNEGWIHDQDNNKVIRSSGNKDILLAQEKGINTYKKVADNKCKAAQDWWLTNKDNWALVRAKWDRVFEKKTALNLKTTVNNKPLYKHLFSDEFLFNNKDVDNIIEQYVIKETF